MGTKTDTTHLFSTCQERHYIFKSYCVNNDNKLIVLIVCDKDNKRHYVNWLFSIDYSSTTLKKTVLHGINNFDFYAGNNGKSSITPIDSKLKCNHRSVILKFCQETSTYSFLCNFSTVLL